MFDFLALPGVRLGKRPPESVHDTLLLCLTTCARSAACPACHRRSCKIHSRYQRTLADLPICGQKVCLQMRVRRFFCTNPACSRCTFAEPLPEVAARYARRTKRLQTCQTKLSQAVGSRPGAGLAISLGMPTSPTSLLRLERAVAVPQLGTPRVLGVDDWAFKKGHRYGTILVDLERHCVVDLLPDRTAQTLAAWLTAHPGVEILSRDRAGCYADAARQGAPQAVQVADRFHLLKNVGDVLERLLTRQHRFLREATQQTQASAVVLPSQREINLPVPGTAAPERPLTRAQQERVHRRESRVARYERAVELQQQGRSQREIARTLRLSRNTVRKWLDAGGYQPPASRQKRSGCLGAFTAYLKQRWQEGCQNAVTLFGEIVAMGFAGSLNLVQRYVQPWRQHVGTGCERRSEEPACARCVRWWLLGHFSQDNPERKAHQMAIVERLCQLCPVVQKAQALAQRFVIMVKERRAADLHAWLEAVSASQIAELEGFALGLRQDWDAVVAAVSTEVSNGQTEGQVNRLKMRKRQMYGRANFDLLRRRVLQPG